MTSQNNNGGAGKKPSKGGFADDSEFDNDPVAPQAAEPLIATGEDHEGSRFGESGDLPDAYQQHLNEPDVPRAPFEHGEAEFESFGNWEPEGKKDEATEGHAYRVGDDPLLDAPPSSGITDKPVSPRVKPTSKPSKAQEMAPKLAAVVGLLALIGGLGYFVFSDPNQAPVAQGSGLEAFGQTTTSPAFQDPVATVGDANDFYANLPTDESAGDPVRDPLDDLGQQSMFSEDSLNDPLATEVDTTDSESAPSSGVASSAVGSVLSRVTAMIEAVEARLTGRIETLEASSGEQQAAMKQKIEDLEAKVAGIASGRATTSASRPAARPAAGTTARAVPATKPGVVFDQYAITSPNGIFTQAVLNIGSESTRSPSVSEIRVNDGHTKDGYFVAVEVPDSMITVVPPPARGIVTRARTGIHPGHRRFVYFASQPIEASVLVNSGAVDILLAPVGNPQFELAKARREGRHDDASLIAGNDQSSTRTAPSAPITGIRRGPDGRVVNVEELGNRSRVGNNALFGSQALGASRDPGRLSGRGQEDTGVRVVPPAFNRAELVATGVTDLPLIHDWQVSAMTPRIAILINMRTGQRLSVMQDTFIDGGVGRVTAIDTAQRRVETATGVIVSQ